MAERLPRYQSTGVSVDPFRPAQMPGVDYGPIMRESRNLAEAQQRSLNAVIEYAGKIGMEQAEEKGRASVDTAEKAKQVLQSTKEGGMPRSIYDKAAYDQANELVILQLQNDGRRLISEKLQAYKNDPNADPIQFIAETADLRDGMESVVDLVDPKYRGRVSGDLDRMKNVGFLEISERHNDRVAQQIKATGLAGIEQRSQDMIRIIPSGAANGEKMVFQEMQALRQFAVSALFSPVEVERQIQSTLEQVHMARFRKEYERATNKGAFLKEVKSDLGRGPIGDLYDAEGNPIKQNRVTRGIDVNKMGALVNEIEADLRSKQAQASALRTDLRADVGEMSKIFSLGQIPSEGVVNEIVNRSRSLGLQANDPVMRQVNYLSTLRQNSVAFNTMSPVSLNNFINNRQSEASGGATLEQSMLIDVAKNTLAHKINMLDKDPVTLMRQTNSAEVKTLNFNADEPDLTKQIGERITQSNAFAASMDSKPKYFSQSEANALSTYLETAAPNQQIDLLSKLNRGFGKNSFSAMREISKTAPEFAYLGGLILTGGEDKKHIARDALIGMQHMKAGNKPFEGTGDSSFKKTLIADQLGSAYSISPPTRNALIATADAIYTKRAIDSGKTTFDERMFTKAFQDAAGATKGTDGNLYGGIIEYRGNRIPIPGNIRQDKFKSIIEQATYEDFAAVSNGLPEDPQGRKYTIEKLRKGYPIFIDTGVAQWSYDNPSEGKGGKLEGFSTRSGTPLEIDIAKLADIVTARGPQKYTIGPSGARIYMNETKPK